MIKSFDMLGIIINDRNFDLTREFELIRNFEDIDKGKVGGEVLTDCEVVIGNSAEKVKVSGMLVKKFKDYDGMSTINDTKICGQKADVIYALTNMAGEVYYFLTWYIV